MDLKAMLLTTFLVLTLPLHPKHKVAITNSNGMSGNWKNSEEEEYVWEEMNSRPTVRSSTDALTKDHWTPDTYDRLDFDSHLQRSQNIHDDDDASADSISLDLNQVAPGTQLPMWSQKSNPPEARLHSGTGKSVSGYSEGYPTGKSSQSSLGKIYSLSQVGPVHIGAPSLKFSTNAMPAPNVSLTHPRHTVGAISSLTRSVMHQRPPSPSFSSQNPKSQPLNNFPERNQTSVSLPTDPRRPLVQGSTQRAQIQNLRSSSATIPPNQQKKHASSAQPRKNLEVHNLLGSQISGSESRSTSDQSNPFTVDSPGKSITSSLFDAVGKSVPKSTTISCSLTKPSSQETRPGLISTLSQKKVEQPSLKTPNAVSSTSNPVSSLLSSLVAKGLISSSSAKSDSLLSVSPNKIPDHPLDRVSSLPVTGSKPLIPIKDEPSLSEPAVIVSDGLPESPAKIKSLIGFEFRPDVVRNLHPDVISDLSSDVPHQCSICGLRLKLQERLDRHMEWHALRVPEDNNPSRSWYADLVDWVDRMGPLEISGFSDDEILDCGPMVPADESQCACVLCGELFEDFYSQESDEWMFKGAVYLTEPSLESREMVSTTSDSAAVLSPIVHANCLSEDTVRDLGMNCDVKLVSTWLIFLL
ncbi:polyadenylation and cleavage factor homolog 4 [Phtheirospermum japonicum]|uniref:Polyadenylation and cleavage factor homolog 4 n=1 Tax=Phtheirospermum japonicum TaxID=374723 RepID=A0A830BMP3_9LAMI|nr:polyadenylation and cleavage factor homolog 4 [Phtheirospermum japonicum]